VELATAAAVQEQAIERQHQQQQVIQQEAERLTSELAEKTIEQQQLALRLAEEQARRAQLEAEITAQREQREAELRAAQEAYAQLIADLQTEIARKDIAIHEFTDQLAITIVDRVLFPSGQATLTAEGKQILEKVGQVLARSTDRRIQIEGHTDNQEIGPELKKRFASNWELSTARATEVERYLLVRTSLPAERLLAVGRADTMPVASNGTEAGRQQNRRIEIVLLPPDKFKQTVQDVQRNPG
jgi:chemotaxis protein MotB